MVQEKGGDTEYLLFAYCNADNNWSVRAIFNPDSEEFSVRTDIGMLEFALIEFITSDFAMFRAMVEDRLARIIRDYYVEPRRNFSVILKNKGLPDVDWDEFLPAEYDGFRCLIRPNQAVRIINGSYMILSYYQKESGAAAAFAAGAGLYFGRYILICPCGVVRKRLKWYTKRNLDSFM